MLSGFFKYFAGRNKIFQMIFFSSLFFSCLIIPRAAFAAYDSEYWNLPVAIASPAVPTRVADYAGSDESIDFNWGESSPVPGVINVNGFVARWTQTMDLDAGRYYFEVRADDGVRVYVDGVAIINAWIDQAPTYYTAYANIFAGSHEIKVEYYENGGGAVIEFYFVNESPVAESFSPADGASGVGLNANLVLTFDRNIYAGAGSGDDIVIYDADDEVVESISVLNGDKVNISGGVVTINPATVFEELAEYYVLVQSDVFYSDLGAAYGGISDATVWNFTAGDFTAPATGDDYGEKDGEWQNSDQTITLSPSDNSGSGIAWTKYCTDDGVEACDPSAGTTLGSPYQITISEEGTTYLRYASQDNSGNTQDAVSLEVKIDKTDPIADVGSDCSQSVAFSRTASASDALSGVDASTYAWAMVSGPGSVVFGSVNSLTTSIDASVPGIYVISFSVSDIAGNMGSDSFIFTKAGSGSLPPQAFVAPVIPVGGFGVKINGGAVSTSSRSVILQFIVGDDVKKIAISRTGDFSDAGIEDFSPAKSWDLCGGDAACADGDHNVYVKFYTVWGKSSQTVSASINLLSSGAAGMNGDAVVTISSGNILPVSGQANYVVPVAKYIFTRRLRQGMTGEDVRQLQMLLNRSGFMVAKFGPGSIGNETIYFGPATRRALIQFQKKYNLKPYPGNVGPATLKLLNSL